MSLLRVLIEDDLASQALNERVFHIAQRIGLMEQQCAAADLARSRSQSQSQSRARGALHAASANDASSGPAELVGVDVVGEYQQSLIAWLGTMLERFDSGNDEEFRTEQLARHGSRQSYVSCLSLLQDLLLSVWSHGMSHA